MIDELTSVYNLTPNQPPINPDTNSKKLIIIICSVVGGIILIALVVYFCVRKKKDNNLNKRLSQGESSLPLIDKKNKV